VPDGSPDGPPGDSPAFLARLRRGEARAFEELVIAHQHRVYGVALRMLGDRAEAEDAAQEAFVRAHRALPEFRGESRLSTWLYAIVARLCLSRLDARRRRLAEPDPSVLERLADPAADPAGAAERGEVTAALHQALGELGEERRIVVVLCDLEGLSYEEIARVLEVPVGTVRSRLHRARNDLRDKLERFLG
jgi:RNA polymerase sigma-70 factor (ECF subfamily)